MMNWKYDETPSTFDYVEAGTYTWSEPEPTLQDKAEVLGNRCVLALEEIAQRWKISGP